MKILLNNQMHSLKRTCEFLIKQACVCEFRRSYTVLAIESSCDDACVAVVNSKREVLSEKRLSFVETQRRLQGISPFASAEQHRANIDRLVDECAKDANVRLSDLDAIACTVKPGMIICLKVGVDKALALCRDYRLGFVPVHHMKAHAIVSRLVFDDLEFPFMCLLISGGHAILCSVGSVEEFSVFSQAMNISPGEAIDKVARSAGIIPRTHYGAEVEEFASRAKSEDLMRYVKRFPGTSNVDFDFLTIKHTFMNVLTKDNNVDLDDFCANLQFAVAGHLCQKLNFAFQYVDSTDLFKSDHLRNFVISGGVAANSFIRSAAEKIATYHGFKTRLPPKQLVTDNAVMIAWTAVEMLNVRSNSFVPYDKLPSFVEVEAKSPIGHDLREEFGQFRPQFKLRVSSLRPKKELLFKKI